MPSTASRRAVLAPIPHSASVGRSPSTSYQFCSVSRNTPSGLPSPVASLACSLFWPMPTEACSPVPARIRAAMSRATCSGSPAGTARNASSQPSTSVVQPVSRRMAITSADAASYSSLSTGRNTQSGQRRAAVRRARPECTPYCRAS